MIDMHSHVLPVVDDGSQDMTESLDMIRQSADSGVKILVVTPHANQKGRFENYYRDDLIKKFRTLKNTVEQEEIKTRLVIGMEIYASPDLQELIENRILIGLNMSDYYLTEFPFEADPTMIYSCLDQIFNAGGVPIIAHPERYTCIQQDPTILYDWIQEGVCTQVNKGSVLGSFGSVPKQTAEFLYDHDLVTCIGSDAHGSDIRTTDMSMIRDYLTQRYGSEYFKKISRDNPLLILKNQDVPPHGRRPDPEDIPRITGRPSQRRFFY